MTELPTGTVTFLFTDVEGSTRLWEEQPAAMARALPRHDEILRGAVEAHHGVVVKSTGDGIHAAFAAAPDAVAAAIDAQLELVREPWPDDLTLRVRMGIHTGEAELRAGDYYGTTTNRAARLMAVAHGGQILCSLATLGLVRDAAIEGVGFADLGEHGLRDLAHPERLFQVTHPELQQEFPVLRSIGSYPTNLPQQLTTFVGREREVAEVAEALRQSRVVTLTGVGGVGKTRLALQVAAAVLPRFRDGAWLCELGPVRDADAVPEVVAAAVGAPPPQGRSIVAALLDYLQAKQTLLVLDNCEHVIAAVADVVREIAQRCPRVCMLATSREGLGIAGERLVVVGSLPLPRAGSTPAVALQSEAVRLFAERAAAVRAGFEVDDANVDAVVEICRRLDGIPLAIELAAARARALTAAEIAQRLGERFRLLTGGSRSAVERHQTLRAAVDWSYDLLRGPERAVLRRLAVFAGGFDLDAAERVAANGDVDGVDVLDLLEGLVEKSLALATEVGTTTRYRMLETIRQYAAERLDEAGEADTVRRRHAVYFRDLAALAGPHLRGAGNVAWSHRIWNELENLRAALTWLVETGDADGALRLVSELTTQTWEHPIFTWPAIALGADGALDHPLAPYALAWTASSRVILGQGLDDALEVAHRALELADELDVEHTARLHTAVGGVCLMTQQVDEAFEQAEKAVRHAEREGDDYWTAAAYTLEAAARAFQGDLGDGVESAEHALAAARRSGNTSAVAQAVNILGFTLVERDPDRALTLFDEAIELGSALGLPLPLGYALALSALLYARRGNPKEAAKRFREALDVAMLRGDLRQLGASFGHVSVALDELGAAEPAAVVRGAAEAVMPGALLGVEVGTGGEAARSRRHLEEVLGPTLYASLRGRGAAMDADEAVRYAVDELERVAD
ncbi:MAG TPA: adenylate/guanylate cyclase domain-containing protein [Acidimicrobiia bacterium]|nr:adenylate/guanylate cyclase domain-containing protein [Acidimicrobiia bacterium]